MGEALAQRAEQMLGLWSALAMNHVALGTACACGMGGISLRLEDFELDIVGYLEDAGLRSGIVEVEAFFSDQQACTAQARPLVRLLEDAQQERLPEVVSEWLMPKVERTLRSFAELHGPRAQG